MAITKDSAGNEVAPSSVNPTPTRMIGTYDDGTTDGAETLIRTNANGELALSISPAAPVFVDETTGAISTVKVRSGALLTNDVEEGGTYAGISGTAVPAGATVVLPFTANSLTIVNDDATVPANVLQVSINSSDVYIPLVSRGQGCTWENTKDGITQIKIKCSAATVNYVGYYQKNA